MNQIGIETLQLVGGEFCLRWSIALLHFLWQGAVIGVLVIAAGRLLRKRSAGTRYTLHAMALLSLPVCLAVTFAVLDVPPSMRAIMASSRASAPNSATGNHDVAPAFPILATPGEVGGGEDVRVAATDTPIELELPASGAERATTPAASPNGAPPFLSRAAPLVTGIYLAVVLCFFIRLALAVWGGHRLRWSAARVEDPQLLERIVAQAHKIGLRFVPLVTHCEKVAVPTVVGVIRPVILIPLSSLTGLEPQQLAIIIGHELAHIRRYDLAMNLVQRVIESLLFFHPVVWYVSRRMSAEREACCDDLVLSSGCERTCYAGAILRMAEVCAARPGPGVAALAASGNTVSQFELRIRRLMSASEHPRLRLTRTGAATFSLLLASVVLTPAVLHSWVHARQATDAVTIDGPVKSESLSETGVSVAAVPEGDAALAAAEEPTRRGAADLAPPVRVMAGGKPIDVGGCAAPFFGDFDGDGRKDLLVGQYDYGRLRIYRNIGANAQPKFDSFEWFKAGGRIAGVPSGCISGFAPQLVDFDADGRSDIVTGSFYPALIYLYRRNQDGKFAEAEVLEDKLGSVQMVGSRFRQIRHNISVFGHDWDEDGDVDLLVGRRLHLVPNEGSPRQPLFGDAVPLTAEGEPIRSRVLPCIADWDGDGRDDLVIGDESGIVWCRNTAAKGQPVLQPAQILVSADDLVAAAHVDPTDGRPQPKRHPYAVCVTDFNADGRMDLLLGDTWFVRQSQTDE